MEWADWRALADREVLVASLFHLAELEAQNIGAVVANLGRLRGRAFASTERV